VAQSVEFDHLFRKFEALLGGLGPQDRQR